MSTDSETLLQVVARQVEDIHYALGLGSDEEGAPVPPTLPVPPTEHEVHQRRQDDAKAAGERMARHREDWHQAKMRLAALGLGVQDEGGTLSIRLPLAAWHKILDRLEASDG